MSIENIIMNFKDELHKEYGKSNGIVKIAFTPEIYNAIINDIYTNNRFRHFSNHNNLKIFDIEIHARERDSF